jgi:outer membrane protein assembly factor BamB
MLRRSTFIALTIAVGLVGAGCNLGSWPMYAYGPAHTSYNAAESTIGVGNVNSLQPAWTAVMGIPQGGSAPPVVANGVVYATSGVSSGTTPFKLEAFDAKGVTKCSGAPTACRPLWTGALLGAGASLNVANGVVYVVSGAGRLYAFDAAGVKRCKGTPKTCSPLWTATSGLRSGSASMTIANGLVFASGGGDRVVAFDAVGVKGCSGTPKTCQPLWSVKGAFPAVGGGVLYVSGHFSDFEVLAYDAAGVRKCSGNPKTCAPLWTDKTGDRGDIIGSITEPTVANGLTLIGVSEGDERSISGQVFGFSASGQEGCTGTPKICSPIWRAPSLAVPYPPAVAKNVVYTVGYNFANNNLVGPRLGVSALSNADVLSAFAVNACHTPTVSCRPLWTANLPGRAQGLAIANGIAYVATTVLTAYDAAGQINCSGSPKVCSPLLTNSVPAGPPAIANGVVFTGSSSDNALHAFALPQSP